MKNLLNLAKLAAVNAGREILKFYSHRSFDDEFLKLSSNLILHHLSKDLKTELKNDNSPVTSADLAANKVIFEILQRSNIPICSEEQILTQQVSKFWLVDPLDGTKDFIEGNGEFCVCIALIENFRPSIGVIFLPVTSEIFYASNNIKTKKELFKNNKFYPQTLIQNSQNLNSIISGKRGKNATASKVAEILDFEILRLSSAIKFTRIAQGLAGAYLRYSPSNLWDNAAGDLIVTQSDGVMIEIESKKKPKYDLNNLKNNAFIAIGKGNLVNEDKILALLKQ